jgi:hypothetical protein
MLSNTSLVETLKHHFDANPELKQECLMHAKAKIKKNLENRVFDEFPLLIERSKFLPLVDRFNEILKEPIEKNIQNFEIDIIKMACDALLDEKGRIESQLITYLEWNNLTLTSKMDNYHAVCAFVGALTASVVNESASVENNEVFADVASYLNPNYGKWVIEVMRENGIPYNPAYNTDQLNLRDIMLYPIRKPAVVGASLVFGGFLGAALYSGYQLYKRCVADKAVVELSEGTESKLKPS